MQPKCLEGLRALKLKEGTVTVAPSLSKVLDEFLTKKGFERVNAILGNNLLLVPYFGADMKRAVFLSLPVLADRRSPIASALRKWVGFLC